MKSLQELVEEGLMSKAIIARNKFKRSLMDIKHDAKAMKELILNKIKELSLTGGLLGAGSVHAYNESVKKLMDDSASGTSDIKLSFEKNSDKNLGDWTVYVMADKCYAILFNSKLNFAVVKEVSKSDAESVKYLGNKLPKNMENWMEAVAEIAETYK